MNKIQKMNLMNKRNQILKEDQDLGQDHLIKDKNDFLYSQNVIN